VLLASLLLQVSVVAQARTDQHDKSRPHIVVDRCAEYQRRAAQVAARDVDARFRLARWCRSLCLYPEMRAEARKVLAIEPDHAGARELLGQMKVGGQWLRKADAMKKLGFVRYKGKWRKPSEVARLEAEAARRKHVAAVARKMKKLARRISSPSNKTAAKARDDLIALGRSEGFPEIGYHAVKAYHKSRLYWKAYRVEQRTALLELRLQKTTLLGLDNFTTSLGFGSPVTLQLPRTRSISIGTTVSVPLGSGR